MLERFNRRKVNRITRQTCLEFYHICCSCSLIPP